MSIIIMGHCILLKSIPLLPITVFLYPPNLFSSFLYTQRIKN